MNWDGGGGVCGLFAIIILKVFGWDLFYLVDVG